MSFVVYQRCDQCGLEECIEFTENYSTLTIEDLGWKQTGTKTIKIFSDEYKRSLHICDDCYKGSSYEIADKQDIAYDREKDRKLENYNG